jgi:rhodanese-related sulfurtransferase
MNVLSHLLMLLTLGAFPLGVYAEPEPVTIYQATLQESDQPAPEISTDALREILADNSATVFDARPYNEYARNHIPGVVHVRGKPGSTSAHYTTDAEAIAGMVGEDKAAPIVVYCSGPFCGRSKRAAKDLLALGYTQVRRYQLGMPVWRALGGVTEIELDGITQLYGKDQTAVWLDVRDPDAFRAGTLEGAHNLPHSGATAGDELDKARKDGRLPVEDHNTRIIVFGQDGATARAVAELLTRKAFHNVAYFGGSFADLQAALP